MLGLQARLRRLPVVDERDISRRDAQTCAGRRMESAGDGSADAEHGKRGA